MFGYLRCLKLTCELVTNTRVSVLLVECKCVLEEVNLIVRRNGVGWVFMLNRAVLRTGGCYVRAIDWVG